MLRTKWTRVIAVVLVLITVAGIFSACAKKNQQEEKQEIKKLSEMSDEELLQRLEEENITIPKGFTVEDVRKYVDILEADPDYPSNNYSFILMVELIEGIRSIVKSYSNVPS